MSTKVNPKNIVKKFPKDLSKQSLELEKKGWVAVERSDERVKLTKKPQMNIVTFVILLILGVVPALIYALYYATKTEDVIILALSEQ
ncbi:hypothetical protein KC660_04225 [Candidatus Dojkabacteria bacterium]|uniref:Uncharacterized protein n=1 Tax=Candidatus Dojkabacteria bacterium TaxID=2099670 RepID=A0A955L489_9BACT|nr:hypothetical protein [Candidatus Dojkabacteria bacterium]